MTSPSSKPAITLDELIALNEEIASLVRAGVPLDQGLRALGADLPGRLGRFATELSGQIARGESLTDALADSGPQVPRVYRAVVEAGIAGGRLPAALESLAGSLRRLAETRRTVAITFIYPVLLLCFAWGLFAFAVQQAAAVIRQNILHPAPAGRAFHPVSDAPWPNGPVLGTAGTGRHYRVGGCLVDRVERGLGRRRPARGDLLPLGALDVVDAAALADCGLRRVAALLVEHRVPMDQAVALAAEASGDGALIAAARQWADNIRQGRTSPADGVPGLPPLLRWLIAGGRGTKFCCRRCGRRPTIIAAESRTRPRSAACCCRSSSRVSSVAWLWQGTVCFCSARIFICCTD